MIRNTRHFMAPISLFGVALLMLACGQESSDKSRSSASPRQNEESREGVIFQAQLLPLNSIVAGPSVGFIDWEIQATKTRINLMMTNTPEELEHYQAIHSGNRCPTQSADLNADGIIDMKELETVSGNLLFALDSDPASNDKGDFSRSLANSLGNYVYWSEVDNQRLRTIASNESPDNKVVVVYGVNQNYNLPSSVYSKDGNKHRYIPISCGVIKARPDQNLY